MALWLLSFSVKGMLPTTFSVLQLQHHEAPSTRHTKTLSLPAKPRPSPRPRQTSALGHEGIAHSSASTG